MKQTIAWCFAALMLAGCATVEGLGKDIQAAGAKIESAADSY